MKLFLCPTITCSLKRIDLPHMATHPTTWPVQYIHMYMQGAEPQGAEEEGTLRKAGISKRFSECSDICFCLLSSNAFKLRLYIDYRLFKKILIFVLLSMKYYIRGRTRGLLHF